MSTSEPTSHSRRPERPLVAVALAVLAIGAGSYEIISRVALAGPRPASPPPATTSMTRQLVPSRAASADADFGPGQCEPCVVGLQ